MKTVIITGGTGLIGKQLTALLIKKGYNVIIFSHSRQDSNMQSNPSIAHWNIHTGEIDTTAIAKADYIIHLTGAGVADRRWTKARKKEIVESRTKSSALLVKALSETDNHITAVVASSAIGCYGPDSYTSRKNGFTEDELSSNDFLGETCRLWEESIEPVRMLGKRLIKLRTGIVLSNEGGALAEFKKPLKAGIAAILGSGSQVVSWIHIEDICRMYLAAIQNEKMNGVYNAVAPAPVTNKELTLALAKKMRGNAYLPIHIPAFALQLTLGEMSVEVLKSTTVNADKILQSGFSFSYSTIEAALVQLIQRK
ncbi:TIGR01777 family protein [Ilyomonas limi]|uniref:TIGR01777 family protein n=1 Tax=Ilyomonas limi TaxID=2575867 RepID=A0A4V5UUC3_9BACT|nr:TIGR01777 family oxidoreductase [Ilyomonas limi]TKK66983.1 TIGR01777 family protein [Ilyomonas limi]